MWKKVENDTSSPSPEARQPARRVAASRELATIGPSISVQGSLTGEEDLLIQGQIEGEINFNKHNVLVGKDGRVRADIHGRSIRVEGEVQGNLYGAEEVVIHASGRVQGNLVAPRVSLENGSKFKGSIDMEPGRGKSGRPSHGTSAHGKQDKAQAPGTQGPGTGEDKGPSTPTGT